MVIIGKTVLKYVHNSTTHFLDILVVKNSNHNFSSLSRNQIYKEDKYFLNIRLKLRIF